MTIGLLVDGVFGKVHETRYKRFSWSGNVWYCLASKNGFCAPLRSSERCCSGGGSLAFPDPHDRLAAGVEVTGKRSNSFTSMETLKDFGPLLFGQSGRTATVFPFRLGSGESLLSTFDQQVAFKLGNSGENLHGHLPC